MSKHSLKRTFQGKAITLLMIVFALAISIPIIILII